MQLALGLGAETDLTFIRDRLGTAYGRVRSFERRDPIGQLVNSLISSRTLDEVSLHTYDHLVADFAGWSEIMAMSVAEIEANLAEVTFPDAKAQYLRRSLRSIATDFPNYDLNWLGRCQVDEALRWLERLPGVGRKVSASTLNFSTLAMPAFVVDKHILRVLGRYGLISHTASTEAGYHAVMSAAEGWDAIDLAEFHIFVKHLGQTTCRTNQVICHHCPIQTTCRWAAQSHDPAKPCSPSAFQGLHDRARGALRPRAACARQ